MMIHVVFFSLTLSFTYVELFFVFFLYSKQKYDVYMANFIWGPYYIMLAKHITKQLPARDTMGLRERGLVFKKV